MAKTFGAFNIPATSEEVQKFSLEKTDSSTTDESLLATLTDANSGDVAIITTKDGETILSQAPYMYDGTDWFALVGEIDADKLILQDDILCAGSYTQVGNITKSQNGTYTITAKGKSVQDVLTTIFTKTLQPATPTRPSVGNATISATVNGSTRNSFGIVEAGSILSGLTLNNASFNSGSYTYGPSPTGCTPTSTTVNRVANPTSLNNSQTLVPSSSYAIVSFTDATVSGTNIIVGDRGGTNVASSVQYTSVTAYSVGNIAYDNLGNESSPEVRIAAGSASKTYGTFTPFRKYFYGAFTSAVDDSTITSSWIRSQCTNSSAAAVNGTTINNMTIPEGCNMVIIAYPATLRDLNKVADDGAFGTDIKGSFVKSVKSIEGANGYTGIDYKVYVYRPAAALGANTYDVTI